MASAGFRVKLNLSELKNCRHSTVWYFVNSELCSDVRQLKQLVFQRFQIDEDADNVEFWLDDCMLPDDEPTQLLKHDDLVVLRYCSATADKSQLDKKSSANVTSTTQQNVKKVLKHGTTVKTTDVKVKSKQSNIVRRVGSSTSRSVGANLLVKTLPITGKKTVSPQKASANVRHVKSRAQENTALLDSVQRQNNSPQSTNGGFNFIKQEYEEEKVLEQVDFVNVDLTEVNEGSIQTELKTVDANAVITVTKADVDAIEENNFEVGETLENLINVVDCNKFVSEHELDAGEHVTEAEIPDVLDAPQTISEVDEECADVLEPSETVDASVDDQVVVDESDQQLDCQYILVDSDGFEQQTEVDDDSMEVPDDDVEMDDEVVSYTELMDGNDENQEIEVIEIDDSDEDAEIKLEEHYEDVSNGEMDSYLDFVSDDDVESTPVTVKSDNDVGYLETVSDTEMNDYIEPKPLAFKVISLTKGRRKKRQQSKTKPVDRISLSRRAELLKKVKREQLTRSILDKFKRIRVNVKKTKSVDSKLQSATEDGKVESLPKGVVKPTFDDQQSMHLSMQNLLNQVKTFLEPPPVQKVLTIITDRKQKKMEPRPSNVLISVQTQGTVAKKLKSGTTTTGKDKVSTLRSKSGHRVTTTTAANTSSRKSNANAARITHFPQVKVASDIALHRSLLQGRHASDGKGKKSNQPTGSTTASKSSTAKGKTSAELLLATRHDHDPTRKASVKNKGTSGKSTSSSDSKSAAGTKLSSKSKSVGQTSTSQKQSTISPKQSSTSQKQSSTSQKQSSTSQKQSSTSQKQSSTSQKQSSTSQKQSSTSQKQSSTSQKQSSQKQLSSSQKQSSSSQKQPSTSQKQTSTVDGRKMNSDKQESSSMSKPKEQKTDKSGRPPATSKVSDDRAKKPDKEVKAKVDDRSSDKNTKRSTVKKNSDCETDSSSKAAVLSKHETSSSRKVSEESERKSSREKDRKGSSSASRSSRKSPSPKRHRRSSSPSSKRTRRRTPSPKRRRRRSSDSRRQRSKEKEVEEKTKKKTSSSKSCGTQIVVKPAPLKGILKQPTKSFPDVVEKLSTSESQTVNKLTDKSENSSSPTGKTEDASEIVDTKPEINYEKYSILDGEPRVNDIIAYKMIDVLESGEAAMSELKIGKVAEYSSGQQDILITLTESLLRCQKDNTLEIWKEDSSEAVIEEVAADFSNLIEVRLIRRES